MKYQYNSTIAFDRAFKKNFGITPVECRQKDIVEIEKNIYSKWIKSTNINIDKKFSLEYYKGENCYICPPIAI